MDNAPKGTNEGTEPRSRSNAGLIALVVLLLISNVVMLYLLMQRNKEVDVKDRKVLAITSEKENVTRLLEEMIVSYDTLSTENEQLTVEMEAQRERIEALLDQVKRGNYDLAKAKKEAETLRRIMKGYVVTIDSLNQVNQALASENITIRQELGEVKGAKEALESKTEDLEGILARGAVLHTTSISSVALFMRNNGKQVETDRAKRAEKVKSCFTLGANRVTRKGDKTIYMRIISPDGKVLPAGGTDNRFRFKGVEGEYSAKREVNYQGEPLDVCIFWNGSDDEMRTGQYMVEIYEAGELVSESSFTLK